MMLKVMIESRCEKIPESGCWIWLGATTAGYGCFRKDGDRITKYAHRTSYEAFVGPIPTGMQVMHRCDVRSCCNPHHLEIGTNADNIKDSMNKGRRKGITRKRPSGLKYVYTCKPGPKGKISTEQLLEIKTLYSEGNSLRKLATKFNVSNGTIFNALKRLSK